MEEHKRVFFDEIGALYKNKREELGLSVDDIVAELKLSPDTIRIIEDANIERLPMAVYAKGFYRSYGNLLKIDTEIIDAFINTVFVEENLHTPAKTAIAIPVQEGKEQWFSEVPSEQKKSYNIYKILLIMLAVILFLYFLYWVFFNTPKEKKEIQEVEEKFSESLDSNMGYIPSIDINSVDIAMPSTEKPVEDIKNETTSVPISEATAPKEEKELVVEKAVPTTPATIENNIPASTTTPSVAKEEKLGIAVEFPTWVQVTYEGKTKDFILEASQSRVITFTGPITIKLGNAGAVELTYRGKTLNNLGPLGRVRTYTFND